MKNILMGSYIVAVITAFFVAIIFAFYAFFGFMTWIIKDPLHWISPPPEEQILVSADIILCREKGGIAIISGWSGLLKECQIPK